MRKKLQSLKAINKSNDLKIKVNNEDAKKQTTQTEKKMDSLKAKIGRIKAISSKIGEGFGKVLSPIKSMGAGIKNGAINLIKYIGSFLSLKNIYSTLKSSADAWLSSQNSEAQQLSANIDYMKTAMGSVFAPVIMFVTNLVYQLMKAVQSLVYAFTGVNIFAKATATSMNKTAGGASKVSKSLSGIHSEINNVSSNESSGGDGGSSTGPNIDLSQIDSQMSPLAEKLYDFFSPLVESWNNYGAGLIEQIKTTAVQIGGLISSVWGSFENIITNGTVYSILQNIFGIIGNIAEAFSNAWNYNGNGDAIIQNIADGLNEVLETIEQITNSQEFSTFLEGVVDAFSGITTFIKPLIDDFCTIAKPIAEIALSAIGTVLSTVGDAFKLIGENEIVISILEGVAIAIGILSIAIGIISTAMSIWATVKLVLTTAATALNIALLPMIAIIVAIIAVIAAIVLAIMNWSNICQWLSETWEWIKQKAIEIFSAIGEFLSSLWQGICDTVMNLWNGICEFLSNLWNGIKETASAIFNGIKDAISTAFNTVKDIVSNIWNNIVEGISNAWNNIITKVKEGVSGAWNAITSVFGNITGWFRDKFTQAWSAVKNVFSAGGKIFDGIKDGIVNAFKSVVNAIIRGINKVISIPFNAINGVLSGIRNISIAGIEPFTWIHTFNVPQIPELATGNVAYERTLAMFGEYSGANSNPEITTPQNIMRETFNEVLESHEWNNNKQPVRVQIYWGTKAVVDEIIDGINEKTRQTGKAQIKVAYT